MGKGAQEKNHPDQEEVLNPPRDEENQYKWESSPHGMGRKCHSVQQLLAPLCVVLSVLVLVLLVALIGESHRSIPMAGRLARNLFQGWSGEFQGFPSRMRSPPSIALSLLHGVPASGHSTGLYLAFPSGCPILLHPNPATFAGGEYI
uniref:Uncharacterized protein n=1 Tax=Anas zonorhyncha TaxID=75864 RepID=A0A8B9VBZ7_9AVES